MILFRQALYEFNMAWPLSEYIIQPQIRNLPMPQPVLTYLWVNRNLF